MRSWRKYSRQELDYALRLKASGLTWRVIAERLDRSQSSLQVTVGLYRKGHFKFVRERGDRLAARIEQGVTTRELADAEGISIQHVNALLYHRGLDAEVRAELRR